MLLTETQEGLVLREFRSIMWGNPLMEANQSMRPHKLSLLKSSVGSVPFQRGHIALPDKTNFYYVYTLNRFHIGGLTGGKFELGTWIPLMDFCNNSDFLLRTRFINSKLHVDYSKTYIALAPNRTILIATPAIDVPDTDLQIDLRTSNLDLSGKINIKRFELGTQSAINDFMLAYSTADRKELDEYLIDGVYHSEITASNLTGKSAVEVLRDTRIEKSVDISLFNLPTYSIPGDSNYYTIALPKRPENEIDQCYDLRVYLVNGVTNEGVLIDPLLYGRFLHQLTNRHMGASVNVTYEYIQELGWSHDHCFFRVLIATTESSYVGNINYLNSFNAMSDAEQIGVLTSGYKAPSFWYGENLHANEVNLAMGLPRSKLEKKTELYPIQEIDRLFNRAYLPADELNQDFSDMGEGLYCLFSYKDNSPSELYPILADENDTAYRLSYARHFEPGFSETNITNFGLPVVIRADGSLGEYNIDYTVTGNYWIPKNDGAVVDLRSSAFTSHISVLTDKRLNGVDLRKTEHLSSIDLYVADTHVYLHPGIDYVIRDGKVIVWKAGVEVVSLNQTASITDPLVESGWVTNNRISVNGSYLVEDPDSFVIFIGEKLYHPNEIAWDELYQRTEVLEIPNGVPYSVIKLVHNNFHKEVNVPSIVELRDKHSANLEEITAYRNLTPITPITDPNLIVGRYQLISPFMVEVTRAISLGLIDTDPVKVSKLGVRATIGNIIMSTYDNDCDPITSGMLFNEVVALSPHSHANYEVVSPETYAFLELVNKELMRGVLKLNQFYSIMV